MVTHWVHPEVVGYLAGFCDPLIPSREEEWVWPRVKVADLAADAYGLIACMADSLDEEFLSAAAGRRAGNTS